MNPRPFSKSSLKKQFHWSCPLVAADGAILGAKLGEVEGALLATGEGGWDGMMDGL